MKNRVLTLSWLALCSVASAQGPSILHYGGTALPAGSAPDTAFCKGQPLVEIHGTGLMSAAPPGVFDSTTVHIGGLRCPVLWGSDSLLFTSLPDSFPDDTCVVLTVAVHARLGSTPLDHPVADVVCLTGDFVRVTYPPSPWCVGAGNPMPVLTLGSGSVPGVFCCGTGSEAGNSFQVLPGGEIPLHSGAVGHDEWTYMGGHPMCGDTLNFSADILPGTQSLATYGGAVVLSLCQSDAPLQADLPSPEGGRFAAPAGLHLADDSLGVIVPALSLPGTHILRYAPPVPCADTATLTVTVLPAPQAALTLMAQACAGSPAHLRVEAQGAVGYSWSHGGVPVGADGPELILEGVGDGDTVAVVVENLFGCTSTARAALAVDVKPVPSIVLSAPQAVGAGGLPVCTVGGNLGGTVVKWSLGVAAQGGAPSQMTQGTVVIARAGEAVEIDPGALLPGYEPQPFSFLCITATPEADGCAGAAVEVCTEAVPGGGVFVPEVMTPDGDGYNDVWELRWEDGVRPGDHTLRLFNRAGGKVLEMRPLDRHWGGGGLPDGVYWWVLTEATGRDVAAGGLTIRRK